MRTTDTSPAGRPSDPLTRLLRRTVRPRRGVVAAIAVLSVLGSAGAALIPYLLGSVLEALTSRPALPWDLFGITAAAFALSIACSVSTFGLAERLKIDVDADLKRLVADAACEDPKRVATTAAAGEIATVLSSDTARIAQHPLSRIRLLSAIAACAIVTGYLLLASVPLTLVVLVGVPAMMYVAARVSGSLEARQEAQRELLGGLNNLCADLGLGLRVLRGVGGERAFYARFAGASREAEHAGGQVARTQALLQATGLLLPGALLLAVVGFGGQLAVRGELAPAMLVTFYAAATYLVTPIEAFVDFVGSRSSGAVAARRLAEIIDAPRPARAEPSPSSPTRDPADGGHLVTGGDLVDERTRVRAAYRRLTTVPDDTGLARRWGGLDDADRVTLGGRPVAAIGEHRLREALRFQPLRPAIFSGTVRDLLDPTASASEDELWAALHTANATDIVERLPGGLDENLDAEGRTLSGGQRQRLALARSLVGRPAYLVLEEPVTALDAVTEVEVAHRLSAARRGLTTAAVTSSAALLRVGAPS